ncbi:hypothetical protein PPYR_07964 [Photinus pyralis]|uniref:AB hydrolase-1 domain-containing protein n=1 Tax=Photinus pyralis TaxID=7054 RepID=A0A5N4ARV1_PHOPY|nr:uncharacterized protein LOC116168281 [Photinus pyralis]XP_031340417.1 uncharacterized protein LOC116168624 [Photinus pyralis]KAB0800075.1 hypothetical protein PPYR_07955 [Photinus pyralis]KAB0800084.1 hypothetical protein PPYR_07964 [Photinus pyralis]
MLSLSRSTCGNLTCNVVRKRWLSSLPLSKNLELITKDKIRSNVTNFKLSTPLDKPLVILLSWLLAKQKHMHKFADYYTGHGFDVLNVNTAPWQMLWPTKGTQVIANEVATFLDRNSSYAPLIVHGFSVGGYQWGEVLVRLSQEPQRFRHVVDRIIGQVWDSVADISEIPYGFPMALFPKHKVLQNAMRQYILYHLRTFDKVATCHYVRASQLFHGNMVKAPALCFLSKTDLVGAETSNLRLKENWESLGLKVYWQCWDTSPHVGHYKRHREEYLEKLETFLYEINAIPWENKLQVKL